MKNAQANASSAMSQKITAQDVREKWDKISEQKASEIKSASDLANQIQVKYGDNDEKAKARADAWMNGRSF
jgi:hypothetical protein